MRTNIDRMLAFVAVLGVAGAVLTGCDNAEYAAENTAAKPVSADATDVKPVVESAADAKPEAEAMDLSKPPKSISAMDMGSKTDAAALEGRNAKAPETLVSVDPTTFPVKVSPARLDLGDIPTNDTGRGNITLVNEGDEPIVLNQCKTNCGCTATNCPRGKSIEPGEEVEIEVTLKGGSSPRPLAKTVTLIFDGNRKLEVPISGRAVSYVDVEPTLLAAAEEGEGQLVIRSTDGNPFRITKMAPAIIEDFGDEPLEQHVIYIDWAKWAEMGQARRLFFNLDHPKTERVQVTVRTPNKAPVRRGDQDVPGDAVVGDVPAAGLPLRQLEVALNRGNTEGVLELLKSEDIDANATDRSGQPLISLAAKHGNVEVVQALLDKGADVDAKDRVGRTSLMVAAQQKHPEVVQLLIDKGADLTPRDLVGSSALSWGAGFGDPESVKLLIDAGSDLEVSGQPTGFTPLIWASGFGDPGSVQALIDAGADLEAQDLTHGLTPIMHAARTGTPEKIQLLVDAGADLEARDNSGKTPLLVAAEASGATVDMIKVLIDAGADIHAKDTRDQTVMDLARKRTDPRSEAVRALFEELLGTDAGGDAGDEG